MRITVLRERWRAFAQSSRGKRWTKLSRGAFLAGVLGFLLYQFSRIGWREIWASLPDEPLFYVLLVAMYLLLPVSEGLIYSRLWGLGLRGCMLASFRKRVLNQDVLGYSGEVYLYAWARKQVALPPKDVLVTLKDNLIVSSVASVSTASLLLGAFLLSGQIRLDGLVGQADVLYVIGGALLLGLVASAAVRFRKAIFSVPGRMVAFMLAVHAGRFLFGWTFQILQWWVVVPEASFQSWAILLSAMVLTNRIPFLPSSDLVFVGIGVQLSSMLDVPVATVAAMLLVRSAFEKTLNVSLFAATAVWDRLHGGSPAAAAPAAEEAEALREAA